MMPCWAYKINGGKALIAPSLFRFYMTSSLFDTQPSLTGKEVIWVIGLILGGVGYGALLTLGINTLVILLRSSRTGGYLHRDGFLSLHVLLVILFNTFLQVWNAQSYIKAIFYTDPDHITYFYHDWENIFIVILATLTEGVLVSSHLRRHSNTWLTQSCGIGMAELHDSKSCARQIIPQGMVSHFLGFSNIPLACRARYVSLQLRVRTLLQVLI